MPKITEDIRKQAIYLLGELSKHSDKACSDALIEAALGCEISPDMLHSAMIDADPLSSEYQFLVQNQNVLTNGYLDKGIMTHVSPIITFYQNDTLYVILGCKRTADNATHLEEKASWHAPDKFVYANERRILARKDTWDKLAHQATTRYETYLFATAYRFLMECNLPLPTNAIECFDCLSPGIYHKSHSGLEYKTAYVHIPLGKQSLEEINLLLKNNQEGYKVLKAFNIDVIKSQHPPQQSDKKKGLLFINNTDQKYILKALKKISMPSDHQISSPWEISNSKLLHKAILQNTLFLNHGQTTYKNLDVTLFSPTINSVSADIIRDHAKQTKINEEDLAYLSIKPKRLLLHLLIAYLTVFINLGKEISLKDIVLALKEEFISKYPKLFEINIEEEIQDKKEELQADEESIMKLLRNYFSQSDLVYNHQQYLNATRYIYICIDVQAWETFHLKLKAELQSNLNSFIQSLIDAGRLKLKIPPKPEKQQIIGLTGGVASGKSSSQNFAMKLINHEDYLLISSDEYNDILIDCLKLQEHKKHQSILTLAEAWFIKVQIWTLLNEQKKYYKLPHIIQEAMSPADIQAHMGTTCTIFISTANPIHAVSRAYDRGEKTGRYVSASNTVASYRALWPNLCRAIYDKKMGICGSHVTLIVQDTDAYYAHQNKEEAYQHSIILTIKSGQAIIHNLSRLITFINYSSAIHPAPKGIKDTWLYKQLDLHIIKGEISKLFEYRLEVIINGKRCNLDDIMQLVQKQQSSAIKIQRSFKFWKNKKGTKDQDNIEINNLPLSSRKQILYK